MNLALAVISDLHVGLAARAKDLCPEPPINERKNRNRYDAKTDTAYRQTFVQFVQEQHLTANYLIIPGDVTSQAKPQEVKIASEFILQAADVLKVPQANILFVPGNHDVDWSVFDATDKTGVRWGQRYTPIGHAQFCFRRILDQGTGDVLSSPHFIVWNYQDLLAVGYNSASHDAPITKEAAHHGLADPGHLVAIRAYLERIGPPDDRVRLFLVHHHALDFANPVPQNPDFSLMTNAEHLLAASVTG